MNLEELIPNVLLYREEFLAAIIETLVLMFWSGLFSFIFGLFFGVVLTVTKKGAILEHRFINASLNQIINIFRSIPFIILIPALFPLAKFFLGTVIGTSGAVFTLVFGCVPFFTRQVDLALSGVNPGLIEAAQSMGLSPLGIIFRVYLKESIPALARAVTITAISLLGLTAMAGAVGSGGLGSFVINTGHVRHMYDIVWVSVLVILVMVSIMQSIGNFVERKTSH